MREITRNRTIRPSTRMETQKSYKIDTKAVTSNKTYLVNVDHETKNFRKSYRFSGQSVAYKNSINFKVEEKGQDVIISWSGATPI